MNLIPFVTQISSPAAISQIIQAVHNDYGLPPEEKEQLISILSNQQQLRQLLSGATGAALAVLIGKYFKLSNPAKVLLGIAGFGLGNVLYDKLKERKSGQFATYNDKINTYEMDSRRY